MENENYPDLILPPFWGNSDILTFDPSKLTEFPEIAEEIDPRGLYCYFPVITEEGAITLLNPYNETEELVTLRFKDEFKRYAEFFRPDGDLCAVSAVSQGFALPEAGAEEVFAKMIRLTAAEIKRGLMLTPERGKTVGFTADLLKNPEAMVTVAEEMSIEDRLGFTEEDFGKRVRFSFHFHNVRDE